jgi:hypothetical protein
MLRLGRSDVRTSKKQSPQSMLIYCDFTAPCGHPPAPLRLAAVAIPCCAPISLSPFSPSHLSVSLLHPLAVAEAPHCDLYLLPPRKRTTPPPPSVRVVPPQPLPQPRVAAPADGLWPHMSWRLRSSPAEPRPPTSAAGVCGAHTLSLAAGSHLGMRNRPALGSPP